MWAQGQRRSHLNFRLRLLQAPSQLGAECPLAFILCLLFAWHASKHFSSITWFNSHNHPMKISLFLRRKCRQKMQHFIQGHQIVLLWVAPEFKVLGQDSGHRTWHSLTLGKLIALSEPQCPLWYLTHDPERLLWG
jgi:hypothetical protein